MLLRRMSGEARITEVKGLCRRITMFRVGRETMWSGVVLVIFGFMVSSGVVWADWEEEAKVLASDEASLDYFGFSVSVSGDSAIIGAYQDDDRGGNSGSAYIFERSNDPNDPNWYQQVKLTASDGASGDAFGYSVGIDGDYAIVGAYGDNLSKGSAYIFKRSDVPDDPNWYQQAKLTASDGASGDYFGISVGITENQAIVGAFLDDDRGSDSGSAYVFEMPGGGWVDATETAKLLASDGTTNDRFANSVSISGDCALVGAFWDDDKGGDSGSVYVFEMPNGGWVDANETGKLVPLDGASGDKFGYSVSVKGDYAVIGATGDDDKGSGSGSAYAYHRVDSNWTQQEKLLASDGAGGDTFGQSVSLDGDYAIVGAYGNDGYAGSAYVFKRNDANWSEQAKLTASDGAADDLFGICVSISGKYAVVGSKKDDDKGTDSGSAYMFEQVICGSWLRADLSGDCFVNFVDFGLFVEQWLKCGDPRNPNCQP